MKLTSAILVLAAQMISLGCAALGPDGTPPSVAAVMTPDAFAAHVKVLADPALGGRVAGTGGNRKAAGYVADQFRQIGLSPGGEEGTYFQPFPCDRLHVPAPGCGLVFEPGGAFEPVVPWLDAFSAASHVLTPPEAGRGLLQTTKQATAPAPATAPAAIVGVLGTDFAPSAAGKLGAFSAPLVFAGYGLHNHVRGYDDYAHLSARGAVVMILAGEPHDPCGQSKWALQGDETHLAELPYKLRLARRQGAVAALVVTPPALDPQDDIDDVLGDCTGALPAVRISRAFANRLLASGNVVPWLDASFAASHVPTSSGEERGLLHTTKQPTAPMPAPTVAQLVDRIHQTGRPQSFAIGGMLTGKVTMEEARCRNVIGILPPDVSDDGRVVVVGAHYDHIPATGQLAKDVGPGVRSGADDNASGVSAMLLLARALAATTGRRTTYVFVAFDAEEMGFAGSRHYVQHPPVPLERLELMVNIDQVGYVEQGGVMLLGRTLEPGIANAIARARSQSPLRVDSLPVTSSRRWSDQAAFVRAGVPTLFVYDGRWKSPYHSRLDTAEKVSAPGGAAAARLIYRILFALNEAGAK